MDEKIWVPIALAIVAAVTTVAYRHPKEYCKLYRWLKWPIIISLAFIETWNVALIVAMKQVIDSDIDKSKMAAIYGRLDVYFVPNYIGNTLCFALLFGGFLTMLEDMGFVAKS